jgi:hypothetical protein
MSYQKSAVLCNEARMAHQAGSGTPGWEAGPFHIKFASQLKTGTHLYSWVERSKYRGRVRCLAPGALVLERVGFGIGTLTITQPDPPHKKN